MRDDMPKPRTRVVFNEHAAKAYKREELMLRMHKLGWIASYVVCGALGAAIEYYTLWSGCHG
jgi:hypothetical protein